MDIGFGLLGLRIELFCVAMDDVLLGLSLEGAALLALVLLFGQIRLRGRSVKYFTMG